MKSHILCLSALCLCSAVRADVQPVNVVLHDGFKSYSVPSGKVLLIEHLIWALEAGYTAQTVSIIPPSKPAGVGDFQLKFSTDTPDSFTPPRPIRVAGGPGAAVRIIGSDSEAADWRDVLVVGLLVDEQDLYAANVPLKLDNTRVAGGRLMADVTYSSPRPSITRVVSSTDLTGFSADPTGQVERTAAPAKSIASVAAAGPRKFMAVTATARSVE